MTLISDSRMENFHTNINSMVHATFSAKHKKIIATLVHDSCNISRSGRFFLHIGHPNTSITVAISGGCTLGDKGGLKQ